MLEVNTISKKGSLKPLSFDLNPNERLGILGETGSGKTTLLRILAGLSQPDTGEIHIDKEKVLGPNRRLVPGNKSISYLSQYFELPKFIRVEEHLEIPYGTSLEESNYIFRACQIFHLLDRGTEELSGGEKQRIALAKTLLKKPKVLLLDEPFSNLDFNHKRIIKKVINEVDKALGVIIIMVAHDPMDILSWASRIMVLRKGEVVQEDAPRQLYERPIDEYVAGLFGSYSLISVNAWNITDRAFTVIDNRAIVRPYHIEIANSTNSRRGRIVEVQYYGHYTELLVQIENETLFIHTHSNNYNIGEDISLSINKGSLIPDGMYDTII